MFGAQGYCYSSRMTLHQQLPAALKEDVHPEQPSRIIGVFNKLQGGLPTPYLR
jgi:hypothetical protein